MTTSIPFERAKKVALLIGHDIYKGCFADEYAKVCKERDEWRDLYLQSSLDFASYKVTSEYAWKEQLALVKAERDLFHSRCKQLEAELEEFKKTAFQNATRLGDHFAKELAAAQKEVARLKDLAEGPGVDLANEKKLHTYFKKRALEAEDTIAEIDQLINPEEDDDA